MNRLDKIVTHRKEAITLRMKEKPILKIRADAEAMPSVLDFRKALISANGETRIISEVKKTSPTADFGGRSIDSVGIARAYESAGASAISVLTEPEFFSGSMEDLASIKKSVQIPVLCKDFIIDPFQIYEARAAGADAVLLIAAILDSYELKDFISICRIVGITPLVEITNESDAEKALNIELELIGINCRDLKTFEIDRSVFKELSADIPESILVVAESGINDKEDLKMINELGIYSALIGSLFMKTDDPGKALRQLLSENHDQN